MRYAKVRIHALQIHFVLIYHFNMKIQYHKIMGLWFSAYLGTTIWGETPHTVISQGWDRLESINKLWK